MKALHPKTRRERRFHWLLREVFGQARGLVRGTVADGGAVTFYNPPAALLHRAAMLAEPDRTTVYLSFRPGASRRTMAVKLNTTPAAIGRRLRRIGARLHDPLVVALTDPTCPLVPEYRQIAIERALRGMTTLAIARRHRLSEPRVQRMLNAVQLWFESASVNKKRNLL